MIAIYVDGIIIASRNQTAIINLKNNLAQRFEIKDLGRIIYCLGIEFSQQNGRITMRHKGYIKSLLDRFGIADSKPVRTPIDYGSKMTMQPESLDVDERDVPYRELVVSLMYFATSTRPDIAHAVSYLGHFNNCHMKVHWSATKRELRYLKRSMDIGITYEQKNDPILGFVDSDWGNCTYDRRSFTGYVFMLSGGSVSWESKKQRTVALSSIKA